MNPAMSHDIVHLNVGGVFYTTTKATLSRYPHSMLGAMFNGSMATTVDENGYYFIDRDGTLFGYVLNFLRSSQLAVPDGFKNLSQLAVEADFYQIQPLLDAIKDLKLKDIKGECQVGNLIEVIEVRTGSTATMPTNNSRVKTIISGRCDVICSLPYLGSLEKLQHVSDKEFTEMLLTGSNIRLKLGEYLLGAGWKLLDSNVSSSSGYDAKSMISSLIIEQTYRDRWFLPTDSNCDVEELCETTSDT